MIKSRLLEAIDNMGSGSSLDNINAMGQDLAQQLTGWGMPSKELDKKLGTIGYQAPPDWAGFSPSIPASMGVAALDPIASLAVKLTLPEDSSLNP